MTAQPNGFVTTDVAECRSYIRSKRGHRLSLRDDSGSFVFRHSEARVGQLVLNAVDLKCGDGFTVRKTERCSYYAFQFVVAGHCQFHDRSGRLTAQAGDIFVLDPDLVTEEYWSDGCEQYLLRIERDFLESALTEALGYRLAEPLKFAPVSRDPGIVGWLRQFHGSYATDNGAAPDFIADERVANSMERSLLMMLLAGIEHSASSMLLRPASSPAPYYVKRAEAYLRDNFANDITLDDIAAAAGVSVRTIFYGFQRWRDTTPMSYLRNLRLGIAQEQLRKASGGPGAVSAAAMAAGFTNFAQFAKLYKARFGEKPSSTLLRKH